MDKKLKISFDFDGTLTKPKIRELAKTLVDSGADVWILTARIDNTFFESNTVYYYSMNSDVKYIADIVGIPHEKIIYTNGDLKVDYYLKEGFDIHFDDMIYEVNAINSKGGNAVLVDMLVGDFSKFSYKNGDII